MSTILHPESGGLVNALRWLQAQYRWRYHVASSLVSRPWFGLAVFLLVAASGLLTAAMVWVFDLYFQQVETELGASAKQNALLLPLAWTALQTFVVGMFEYTPEVSRFWVLNTSPVPGALRKLDRLLSVSIYVLVFCGPLWAAVFFYAGLPLGGAISLAALTTSLAIMLRNAALTRVLVSAALGAIFGWLGSATLETLLTIGVLTTDRGDFDGWRLVLPLVHALPRLDGLMAFLRLPLIAHLGIALTAFTLVLARTPHHDAEARRPSWLVASISRLPSSRLAFALLHLVANLTANLMPVASLFAYVYATRFFDVPQLPPEVASYLAALLLVQPVRSPRATGQDPYDVGRLLRAHAPHPGHLTTWLFRGWLELAAIFTGLLALPVTAWRESIMLLGVFLMFWLGASWLVRLGPRWSWLLLTGVGSGLLWLL